MGIAEKTMVSYSASFEDVMLQRALQHVQQGCYVDVGASRPLADSNTAAFYGKGWRGICIEPLTYLNPYWAKCRPDDIFINAVVGAESGQATLYYYPESTQISTCSVETMEHWKQHNHLAGKELTVPMLTLNRIMETFLDGRTLHVLSIDAEGSEKQVLQGFDLKKYHPWVMVIEATVPGTHTPSHHLWESDVLEAGYTMAYEDGVNRFYLSNTKPELREYFLSPPNVWDAFVPFSQEEATCKTATLESINQSLRLEVEALRQTLNEKIKLPAHFWDYTPDVDDVIKRQKITKLDEENKILQRHIEALQQSLTHKTSLNNKNHQ